ncbi:FAD-dependent thymidylate synthase [Pedobacter sp.]|nr:FAD-dependent thymidylate synthase [Candidatus Saccharibacteria bacterium]
MSVIELRSHMDVELIQHMGSDASVVWAARVSTKGQQSLDDLDADPAAAKGLINFLMKNRHGTPFEHNAFTFFVRAPIFVFREFHRHRIGFSYNEESGRYKQLDPVFYVPGADRALIQVGRPGHYEFVPGTSEQLAREIERDSRSYQLAYDTYEESLADGVAKEVARTKLPVATYSSMYVTCNARSLMSFLSLRTKREGSRFPSFPQREIEMVAEQMEALWAEKMPMIYESFNLNGRVSP